LDLERRGAHNVNFVTPTPHVPQMLGAILAARDKGFSLPVLYNTSGYDSLETLRLLDGIVDIYLPDMKYRSGDLSALASGAGDYPEHNARAIDEMMRQVGPLVTARGVATRGILVRHLVLPGRVDDTERVLTYLRDRYGKRIPISLMGQYFPAHRAMDTPGFERKLSRSEYRRAVEFAESLELTEVYIQEI
jgi:putative pyruvate formate lyase activating enzyme